jgi:hypothetical protein
MLQACIFSESCTVNFLLPRGSSCLFPNGLDAHWFVAVFYYDETGTRPLFPHGTCEIFEITNKWNQTKYRGPNRMEDAPEKLTRCHPRTPWITLHMTRAQWLDHVALVAKNQHIPNGFGWNYLTDHNCQRFCEKIMAPFHASGSVVTVSHVVWVYLVLFTLLLMGWQMWVKKRCTKSTQSIYNANEKKRKIKTHSR